MRGLKEYASTYAKLQCLLLAVPTWRISDLTANCWYLKRRNTLIMSFSSASKTETDLRVAMLALLGPLLTSIINWRSITKIANPSTVAYWSATANYCVKCCPRIEKRAHRNLRRKSFDPFARKHNLLSASPSWGPQATLSERFFAATAIRSMRHEKKFTSAFDNDLLMR